MSKLSLSDYAKIVRAAQASNNDFVTVISGSRGVGKSTLMMQLTRAMLGGWYDYNKYHVYERKELIDKLEVLPEKSIICVDEAITSVFKREFQKKDQIGIIKLLNMYRDKCHMIFLLIPLFWDLDSAIRNSNIIKLWIYCHKRGSAVIFTPSTNPGVSDPWGRESIMEKWSNHKIRNCKSYLAEIEWDDIPAEQYEIYKAVKARKRLAASAIEDKDKKAKSVTDSELARLIYLKHPDLPQVQIANLLGISKATVSIEIKKLREMNEQLVN